MGEVAIVKKKKRPIKTICFGLVLLASSTFFIALAAYKDGVNEYWEGDYEKALSKLSQEAEDGDAKAHRYLGHLFYNGKGVTKDLEVAFSHYLEAASMGDSISQNQVGVIYEEGKGTSQDLEEAHYWYKRSAEGGSSSAQFNLGLFYKHGKGSVGVDFEKAAKWFERAAIQNQYKAAVQLASLFDGPDATEEDNKKVFDWMLFAAEGGNPVGQSAVGILYYNGKGVAMDKSESLKWHLAAAEQGNLPSQIMIARMFEDGIGTDENLKKAARWYEAAAEQGDAGAQFKLTKFYDHGIGVEKDFEKSFKWAKRAAEQGHKQAQFVVGLYYDYGKGTFENNAEAIKWYRIAAENDVHSAQWNLGLMYEQGEGAPADAIEAKKWFEIAASNGNENAQKKLLVLASEVIPADTSSDPFIKSCPSIEETLRETNLEFGYNGQYWKVDNDHGEMFIDVNNEACSFRFTNFFFDAGTNLPLDLLNDFNLKHSYGFLSQSDEAVIFEYFVILPNADPALLTLNLAYFNIKASQVEEYLINEQTKEAVLSS